MTTSDALGSSAGPVIWLEGVVLKMQTCLQGRAQWGWPRREMEDVRADAEERLYCLVVVWDNFLSTMNEK